MTVEEHHSVIDLERLFREEKSAQLAKRIWIVWQARLGRTEPEITAEISLARRSVQQCVRRYNEVLSNVVDEVVSQAATLGRMMPSWNLVSLATSMRCFAASRVRQWCEADSASLKSIVSVALRVPLPLVRR